MDKDLKLLYCVLLFGENQIRSLGGSVYELKWRVSSSNLVSAGVIEFDLYDTFRIWKGAEQFRWHASKHF